MNEVYYLTIQNLYEVQLLQNKHFKQYFFLDLRTGVPIHACRSKMRQKPDLNQSLMMLIPARWGAIWQKPNW